MFPLISVSRGESLHANASHYKANLDFRSACTAFDVLPLKIIHKISNFLAADSSA
jgi:hypothetical protein